jgi:hypothetical protein
MAMVSNNNRWTIRCTHRPAYECLSLSQAVLQPATRHACRLPAGRPPPRPPSWLAACLADRQAYAAPGSSCP